MILKRAHNGFGIKESWNSVKKKPEYETAVSSINLTNNENIFGALTGGIIDTFARNERVCLTTGECGLRVTAIE